MLPPNLEHGVLCLVDTGDLLGGHFYWLTRFCRDFQWFHDLEQEDAIGLHSNRLQEEVKKRFRQWSKTASQTQLLECKVESIRSFGTHLQSITSSIAETSILSFEKKLNKGRGRKELYSTRTINRQIRKSDHLKNLIDLYDEMLETGVTWHELEIGNNLVLRNNSQRVYSRIPVDKRKEKAKRKRLHKSFAMLQKVAGKELSDLYIGGNEVAITGSKYRFVITKRDINSLHSSGNEIKVTDLEGNHLCNSCVYFDNTPASEQVAAIFMSVKVGMEEDFITKGNLYGVTRLGMKDQLIADIQYKKNANVANIQHELDQYNAIYTNDLVRDNQNEIANYIDRFIFATDRDLWIIGKMRTRAFTESISAQLMKNPTIRYLYQLHERLGQLPANVTRDIARAGMVVLEQNNFRNDMNDLSNQYQNILALDEQP